jgi:Rnl2 family RNA ligase
MEFKKYNSIENAYQTEVLEQIIKHGFEKETYIVQEKVHGANFSFHTNGTEVRIAKRSGFIEENEVFYNAQTVAKNYHERVVNLFVKVKERFPETMTITVFGELYGGSYNHPNVTINKEAIKVQKGINYNPDNDFYAFDIKINENEYLDVALANEFFETIGFFYAKTLFNGSLKEALDYPNEFNTLIPAWLGLPVLENNLTEGVIIRPEKTHFFGNGSRVILKNKNEKWSEKSKVRSERVPVETEALSETAENVWNELQRFLTTNRLYNVLSKEGEFTPKMMGKLLGLFAQDALTDFMKEHSIAFETLEKEERKLITKRLNQSATKLIKEEFITLK